MSSFKKLRLDPELPPAHRNQSGANDSGGRSFLDGSSFSSSTSGGSGAYGRSSGPFRTRYSQPLGAPSPSGSSFSRFAPYYFGRERRTSLRVPLIRARRDDSDSEGLRPSSRASLNSSLGGDSTASATSSTAQRIIETLQNLSTPVMNAGKIRIDQDIKAVQPLPFGSGSPLSRISPGGPLNRSTGPPKMCSSLLMSNPSPANQTSPMFNSGDQRSRVFCIPRMIDAATNTEKDEASSPQTHYSNKTIAVTSPTSQYTGATNMKPVASASSKDDNSEEEFHECSSDFTFSAPWTPDAFERFWAKDDKSISKGNFDTQQPFINGYKEASSTLGAPQLASKSVSSYSSSGISPKVSSSSNNLTNTSSAAGASITTGFSGSTATGNFGLTQPKDGTSGKLPSNLSAGFKTDGQKPFGSGSPASSEINKASSSSPMTGFSFGKPGSSPLKSFEPSKPTLAFGGAFGGPKNSSASTSVDKVDAPKTDSPLTSKSSFSSSGSNTASPLPPLSTLIKPSTTKWRCPTCMAENDVTVPSCVCCGEKNANQTAPKPATTTGTDKKKWRCPTCMVENESHAANCVCCSEKNPNPVSAPLAPLSSLVVPSKKWRCPTCMVENDPTAAACACCSEKNPNPVTDKKDSASESVTAPTPTFKFGVSNTMANTSTAPPASNSSFTFGAPAQSDIQKAPAPSFKFGLQPATTSGASVSTTLVSSTPSQSSGTPTTSSFKFGSSTTMSTTVSATPASTPSFGFATPTSTTTQVASTANTTTTSSSSVFSPAKVPEATNSSGAGGLFGSSSFQTSQSTPSNSFKFGSAPTATTNDAQKTSGTPSFSFGASSSMKPAFNNFSFGGDRQNPTGGLPGASSTALTPAAPTATPTPAIGGSTPSFTFGNPSPSPFGQPQSNPNSSTQSNPGGLFSFSGGGSSNPPSAPSSLTPAPTPSFSLTPNLNFGATPGSTIPFGNPTQPTPNAGSQPPPALFQFNSTPSDSPGGRKIKKAVRRFNK